MENPNDALVTFCMSTYKRPEFLRKQLLSILKQTFPYFKIIVSDNDEEAGGEMIVKEINDPRITYQCNGVNIGMVKSFNRSLSKATTEYVVMITDDDPLYPEMLETLIELQKRHRGFGVYSGCGDWIIASDFAGETLKEKQGTHKTILNKIDDNAEFEVKGEDFIPMYTTGIFKDTFLLWSTCIVERNVAIAIGGMPDYGSELLTDHAFIMAACSVKGMAYINRSLGGQSVRGDNFGYNFEALRSKFVNTPLLFHDYLKSRVGHFNNWGKLDSYIWNFTGRMWVEYSLMIYNTTKSDQKAKKEFLKYFRKAFSQPKMGIWKYKFYLKARSRPLFNILLGVKNIFKK